MSNTKWTTKNESKFLALLGFHPCNKVLKTRIELVKGYIKSLDKRTEWDAIDKDVIKAQAQLVLAEMEGAS